MVKIAKYVVFFVYRRSYLIWSPVIVFFSRYPFDVPRIPRYKCDTIQFRSCRHFWSSNWSIFLGGIFDWRKNFGRHLHSTTYRLRLGVYTMCVFFVCLSFVFFLNLLVCLFVEFVCSVCSVGLFVRWCGVYLPCSLACSLACLLACFSFVCSFVCLLACLLVFVNSNNSNNDEASSVHNYVSVPAFSFGQVAVANWFFGPNASEVEQAYRVVEVRGHLHKCWACTICASAVPVLLIQSVVGSRGNTYAYVPITGEDSLAVRTKYA